MKKNWWLWIILLVCVGCAPQDKCHELTNFAHPLHVLFLGNSYTYVNDLPGTFSKLACSGGYKVETSMHAEGGWTLENHLASQQSLDLIKQQKWDIVVLQEQSEIPALETNRLQNMYPAARRLVDNIRKTGAQPMFFLTFGHRDGLPYNGMPTYNDMQNQLIIGYTGISLELGVPIIPVGKGWAIARRQANPLNLWQDDGSHPNEKGTYLAACVFYASIFHKSPEGLTFMNGLSQEDVNRIQSIAASSVVNQTQ